MAELALRANRRCTALALVVSGGHTHLYLARPAHGTWTYTLVGRTVDDAAGEAYDKVAKLLGLGYPGGPWIDALAQFGNPHAVPFAFAQIKTKVHLAGKPRAPRRPKPRPSRASIRIFSSRFQESRPPCCATWSCTACAPKPKPAPAASSAVPNRLASERAQRTVEACIRISQTREEALALCPQPTLDLIASFQHAVVGDLMKKTFAAAESLGATRILVTGGVAANRELRAALHCRSRARGMRIAFPTLALSTDNAAMIAAAAWPRFLASEFAPADLSADPSLALGHESIKRFSSSKNKSPASPHAAGSLFFAFPRSLGPSSCLIPSSAA